MVSLKIKHRQYKKSMVISQSAQNNCINVAIHEASNSESVSVERSFVVFRIRHSKVFPKFVMDYTNYPARKLILLTRPKINKLSWKT